MRRQGLSPADLAALMGRCETYRLNLNKIRKLKARVTIRVARDIAAALGTDVFVLLDVPTIAEALLELSNTVAEYTRELQLLHTDEVEPRLKQG